jgi:hypothetical protein
MDISEIAAIGYAIAGLLFLLLAVLVGATSRNHR